LYIVIYNIL